MALFKPQENDLSGVKINKGFIYLLTKDNKNTLHADVTDSKRVDVNAVGAYGIYQGSTYIDGSNIADKSYVESSKPKSFSITIEVRNWTGPSDGIYSYAPKIIGLKGSVPPIVSCTENVDEYSNIYEAIAETDKITFRTEIKPTKAIKLTIIDFQ